MFTERTSLGLDVHARSIKAAAIDTLTGELIERTMPSDAGEVMALVAGLRAGHGDVKVTYEAGPTGFELARALAEEGIACQVAAPSKLLRPSGERVKTDRTVRDPAGPPSAQRRYRPWCGPRTRLPGGGP